MIKNNKKDESNLQRHIFVVFQVDLFWGWGFLGFLQLFPRKSYIIQYVSHIICYSKI